METEARGQEPPGVDTSHSDTECRAGKKALGVAERLQIGTGHSNRPEALQQCLQFEIRRGPGRQMSDS